MPAPDPAAVRPLERRRRGAAGRGDPRAGRLLGDLATAVRRRRGPAADAGRAGGKLVPTVKVAKAVGWAEGESPVAAPGLAVTALATGLDHPRWMHVLPNGDVLVAETQRAAATRRRARHQGLGDDAGDEAAPAPACPAPNRITLLRDADGDGAGRAARALARGPELAVRHGAGRRQLLRRQHRRGACAFPYERGRHADHRRRAAQVATCRPGRATITGRKSLIASPDGRTLYVDGRLEQQRRRERHGRRSRPRGDLGDRSSPAARIASVRHRPAQPERHGLGAGAPARCGPSSTSATSSAATSCPTT
ncbi:MAG: hypothetical protein MZW92_69660 [Comamonadaceae bacterium]|nr:hypothetical protein [Comamonadaceae bacterium]